MKYIKKLSILMLGILSVGCTTVKQYALTPDESSKLNDKTIAVTKYNEKPDFLAQTAANVQFGFLGIATAISSGNEMISKNKINDPAESISLKLLGKLKKHYSVKDIKINKAIPLDSKLDDVIGVYGNADYVLDVQTIGWSSIHFSTDWNNYKVTYTAHAKLIDVKNKAAVLEATCTYTPEYTDTNQAPTYQELENGTGLKAALEKSIEYCVENISNTAKLPG